MWYYIWYPSICHAYTDTPYKSTQCHVYVEA